ncbi:MAG: TPM domain-containing protein, partial [Cytophagales bacterium]|nr:TPM domain-containing protein [Cytophagales bacterium]
MIVKRNLFLLAFWFFAFQAFSQSYTVQTVPNPKTEYQGLVSNPDNIISPPVADSINYLLQELENKTSMQVAVVVLNSIGEEIPADFATDLFNSWGIGVKGKDNGLLILMVYDQHRIEFRTGYGMETLLPDVICKRIQMNYMVPRFKEELYDQGMMDGVKATIDILTNTENSKFMAEMDARENQLALDDPSRPIVTGIVAGIFFLVAFIAFFIEKRDGKFKSDRNPLLPNHKVYLPMSMGYWLFLYGILPLGCIGALYFGGIGHGYYWWLVLIVYGYLVFILLENRLRSNQFLSKSTPKDDYFTRFQLFANENQYWFWAAIFFPLPFVFYWLFYKSRMKGLRSHPRNCQLCQQPMRKLDEKADDAYLIKGQVLEEG